MELQRLSEANPWWVKKRVPEDMKGTARSEYATVLRSVGIREVTILTGVRRSGKSTLMYQMIDDLLGAGVAPEQILFVNLEDTKLSRDSLEDIYSAYRENINPDKKAYVFLDEVHKRRRWESWVRNRYDNQNCKFVISGSCSHLLKKEYSTLLTGRNITFDIFPLSFGEFLSFRKIELDPDKLRKGVILENDKHMILNALGEYMNFGGFPAVFFREEEFKMRLLAQYFDDIIYKDIVDRYNLNSQKVRDLALYLLTNFTGFVSLRNLRNTLGLSYKSIRDYVSYFNEAFLLFTLEHFSYSMKEQKTRPSKAYCIDNGLRNAVSFKFSKDEGKLAENLVFLALKIRGKRDVYYWKARGEVDFVVKNRDQSLTAINVSYADEIDERETRALAEFRSQFGKARELLVITRDLEKMEHDMRFVPLWKWLLSLPSITAA